VAQRLDDAPERDVPGAIIHDVEQLAMLIVTGFRVRVAVDDLDRPLGVLEVHLLLLVALAGNLLLAFPLAGRHAVAVWLLLTKLFHELLDLLALGAVAPGVVHQAPRPTLIAAKGLTRSLVTAWAATPTSRYSSNNDSGSTCQRLVVIVGLLLLPIHVLVIALSSDICFGFAGLHCLRSRLGVSCTPFCSPGALVCEAEELRDVFHIMCG
jgi:hypothetical protein